MEDKIVNDWASWNFLEKGIVCEALNKCHFVSEGGINDSLWSLLKQDFLNMSDDIVCDPYISPVIPFSSLLQTHRKFDQYEIQQIFCKFGPNLKQMRPDARIRLLTLIKPITHRYIYIHWRRSALNSAGALCTGRGRGISGNFHPIL